MQVIFIPKPGIDLYRTLLLSETSRMILRFYSPRRRDDGCVEVPVATLGSALSLASELRWYIRRYTSVTLFKTRDGIVISKNLAKEIYERSLPYPGEDWPYSYTCSIHQPGKPDQQLVILCLEGERPESSRKHQTATSDTPEADTGFEDSEFDSQKDPEFKPDPES
ncbi:MAG: hypothetical protein D5R99_04605 [Methanocalculus sp. MSAO_Arc1]|uniref:DUF5804 family protein n=1 Tax=Methanocalculus TaxID=71151 RepID=UPI000FF03579|nr:MULTISPECIES: DUF5804 family protein [unclassified Methanocalculus]MCP1661949.1 hypothetical protein [Methanocalculus sp. AMF5]RQD80538.1 MAG: hypothetical protein D5R99_04605 [Methanocalculus sp. MSAO_Arc1]